MLIVRGRDLRGWILPVLFLACLSFPVGVANSKSLQNRAWLSQENRDAPIALEIGGQTLDLDADLDEVVAYYQAKPADEFLLPQRPVRNKEASECARDLKNNIYRLRRKDPKVELPADLVWSENPFQDRNWEFWLHGWKFADCLMEGYEATGDVWYLDRLKWVVVDWWQDNFVADPPSEEFSWYDHTIPIRLERLTRIWEFVRRHQALDPEFVNSALRLAYWHGRILDEEKSLRIYRHNHGLDQADYLFRGSVIFPELEGADRWHRNALPRMKEEIEFMMSSEGIQKENSPGYHTGHGASAFWRLQWVEHYTGQALSPALAKLEDEALKFATVIAQPDGLLPQLGDTGAGGRLRISLPNLKNLSWYPHYEYVVSKGKRGRPPSALRFIFPESGYYIDRDRWDKPGENTATQLIFKCGFLAEGHRHDDDGHILLYGLGEAWLTDGGQYGYVRGPLRNYMRSPQAHNVTIPEGARTRRDLDERLTRFADSWGMRSTDPESLSSVTCSSHMYRDYLYTRKLELKAPRGFVITDRLVEQGADNSDSFVTQFRVPQDKSITVDEAVGKVDVVSPAGHHRMTIVFDPSAVKSVEISSGETEGRLSVDTVGWREVEPVQTIGLIWKESARGSSSSFEVRLRESSQADP